MRSSVGGVLCSGCECDVDADAFDLDFFLGDEEGDVVDPDTDPEDFGFEWWCEASPFCKGFESSRFSTTTLARGCGKPELSTEL